MILAIGLWVLAMVAGLCWARWVVAVVSSLAIAAALLWPAVSPQGIGWISLIAFGATPWLLAAQRLTHEERVQRIQAAEANRLNRVHELLRTLSDLQGWLHQADAQIARITDLYHVTKETARALRVEELFAASLDIVPRLLNVKGLRLIDLSPSTESPRVLRASRVPDGRLVPEHADHPPSPGAPPRALEQAILSRAAGSSSSASSGTARELACEFPAGISRVAWASLQSEQRPIGILIAEELAPDQLEIFSIVANQFALQLARVQLYQRVETLAITDTLTGLSMRRYFLELATEELQRSARHGLFCAIVMADLDHFKSKNDTSGHLVGDVVLREVSQLLRAHLRQIDLIARYGGEEFILLLVESGPEQAWPVAERLRQLVEVHPIRAYDETLSQTISMGIACFPDDGTTLQELLERADQALYAAKRGGRNRVLRWSEAVKPLDVTT